MAQAQQRAGSLQPASASATHKDSRGEPRGPPLLSLPIRTASIALVFAGAQTRLRTWALLANG
jgi:hypothetical protein